MIHLPDPIIDWMRPYHFRGKAHIFRRLSPTHGRKHVRVFGYEIVLDLADHIQRAIYLGTFERLETAMLRRMLRPGMTFVDVGANVGYFTLLAAKAVQSSGRVISFEPSLYLHDLLASTIRANGLSQVTLVSSGLGNKAGFANLYLNPSFGNNSPTMVEHTASEVTRVQVLRLDDYLVGHEISTIDLLKIDVEGFEPRVLEGASEALASGKIKAVLCEFNDHWLRLNSSSPADLWKALTEAGFRDRTGSAIPPRFPADCVVNHLLLHRTYRQPWP
jgi:FkbM family methyltransferase